MFDCLKFGKKNADKNLTVFTIGRHELGNPVEHNIVGDQIQFDACGSYVCVWLNGALEASFSTHDYITAKDYKDEAV